MRYSPNGQYIAYEHRAEPRGIDIARADTGAVVVSFGPGQNPRWVTDTDSETGECLIVAESPDGIARGDKSGQFVINYVPANRGQLDANGQGDWCVSEPIGTTTVHRRNGTAVPYNDARDPRLDKWGAPALRSPVTGVVRYAGHDLGPCQDSRWSSETLVWWLDGRVWGRTTPDQPTVELTVPGRSCSHACPLWTGSQLFVGLVLDDGELWLATWSDLAAKNGLGWRIGVSGGSAFDWALSA